MKYFLFQYTKGIFEVYDEIDLPVLMESEFYMCTWYREDNNIYIKF